jgi:phosphoribosylformylglycinamidine (FGAM) synthase-like enzyme
LMNDPQIIEASRALAEKMQNEWGTHLEDQLVYGFRRVTGRRPTDREVQIFKEMFSEELDRFRRNKRDSEALLHVGASTMDPGLPIDKTAALTMVANLMFNHFDFYTKQ